MMEYTIPVLIVRDQGYQPLLERNLQGVTLFPNFSPMISFTGPVVGSGQTLLQKESTGLSNTQLKCCGFIQQSTYLSPPDMAKSPFGGFHYFQIFVIFPIHANLWTIIHKKMAEREESPF
ncbi:hypothetical protein BGZ63DRAFT_426764 [Mariannaea sp. PMI_226]|nr:hypothetical protein BGZ63DRAFT_426764 [Mariannaea sp. PMI_226]